MKALYLNGAVLRFSTGSSNANAESNIIASIGVPSYIGGFVADSVDEFNAVRSYVNSNAPIIIYKDTEYTNKYSEAVANLPWLFQAPVYGRTREASTVGAVGAQEALEKCVKFYDILHPQENNITCVSIKRNGVIFHVGLQNISGPGGYSLDDGTTWEGDGAGHLGLIGGSSSRFAVPVFKPDLTGFFNITVTETYTYNNNPLIHDVRISRSNSGILSTRVSFVTALTRIFQIAPIDEAMGGDPYNDLPIGGSDPIPGGSDVSIPGFPDISASSAGVIGLFVPTIAQMQLLSDFMWTDFGGQGTTVEDILQEIVEALKRSISNPLDYIIGLNIIPSQGLSVGASKNVRFGFVNSGVSMPVLSSQYFTVDCGTLAFDTVCGDTFLDYAPYSKFSIYLPYIGFKDVDPNDFVGHTIGVVYHGDCVTGGITAYITKDGSVMYQYSGCCALNVPLSADNWGETISAAIGLAGGIVAAAGTGGAAGLATGALKGAASVAANPSLLSPQVMHSGAISGGAGCMGVQYPFVIREAVNFHSTAGFNKSSGYPAYYYKSLAEVSGFTTVIDAHMTGIVGATQSEIDEIERLLESGVIL